VLRTVLTWAGNVAILASPKYRMIHRKEFQYPDNYRVTDRRFYFTMVERDPADPDSRERG